MKINTVEFIMFEIENLPNHLKILNGLSKNLKIWKEKRLKSITDSA